MKILAVLMVAPMLAGCVYWNKPGATETQFNIEKSSCLAQAYQAAPVAMTQTQIGTGYTQPAYTTCTGFGPTVNCTTTGGQYIPPVVVTSDLNSGARNSIFDGCMMGQGWTKSRHLPFTQ